jgi:CheY-like chemotaxis protein/HPt (histidine-containing phosphotransfer) domain-containing protein
MAGDGHQAVDYAGKNNFDIIFMDCQMPLLDGYAATSEIRLRENNGRHTPIIAMTAHAMKGDREKCIAAGMDDYVSKPIDPDSVLRSLRRWLPEQRPVQPDAASRPQGGADGPAPVLDVKQAMWVTGGKMKMFKRIAAVFLQHMPNRVRELEIAVTNGDSKEMARLAHSIQGAAASLGGRRLRDKAQQFEMDARQESMEHAADHLVCILAEFNELRTALENFDFEQDGAALANQETAST